MRMIEDPFEFDEVDDLSILDLEDQLDALLRTCCPKCDHCNPDADLITCRKCGFQFSPLPLIVIDDEEADL